MAEAPQLSAVPFLAELVTQVGRQTDVVERLGRAADSIARDISSLLATRITAALVRPWANDPHVVRVVLIQSQDDERRLRESVQRYESSDRPVPMEEWLKQEGFRVVETREIAAERQGIATFKAASDKHQELTGPAAEASLEHLELERKPD
ncbi:MAG: hypothetical protein E6K82_25550 [Candidatus Rokuibacteriota bacterium]|nr:MAG: hypothetical protein E6K82_25550 [Candidatus Rokubacteria bacterium]